MLKTLNEQLQNIAENVKTFGVIEQEKTPEKLVLNWDKPISDYLTFKQAE